MKLTVTDANIFIDLIHIDLIDHLFCIDCEIHTCLEVVDELNERQQAVLTHYQQAGRLTVHELDEAAKEEAGCHDLPKGLSTTDSTVLYLAAKLAASVLTGDAALRKTCTRLNFEVHGILWLLECFHDGQFVPTKDCIEKLGKLMVYNTRLPKTDCDVLLRKWELAGDQQASLL